jgi:hypothetical protein
MPRGYWRILLTAVGFLILCALGYGTHQLYKASEQQHPGYGYQPASQPRLVRYMPGKTIPDGYKPHCQNPQTNEDADLCAQWAAVEQVGEANRMAGLNLKFAIASLWATAIATLLLVWNLIETRETSRRELRAYVFFRIEVEEPMDIGKRKMKIRSGLVNTGQTPARRLRMVVRWNVSPPDPPETFFEEPAFSARGSVGFLGAGLDTIYPRNLLATDADAAGLRAGTMEAFIWGRAEYEDVFGRQHVIRFRRRMYKNGGLKHFYSMPSGEEAT